MNVYGHTDTGVTVNQYSYYLKTQLSSNFNVFISHYKLNTIHKEFPVTLLPRHGRNLELLNFNMVATPGPYRGTCRIWVKKLRSEENNQLKR